MKRKIITYFTERSLIVNLITIGLFIAGTMFLVSANREAFPKVEYDYVIATTIYPGATAEDIEKHISIEIENKLRGVEGIEEIWSSSLESRSVVAIKLDPDVANKQKAITDIKDAIDSAEDLPKDAEKTMVHELSTSLIPILEISILNKKGIRSENDERKMRAIAKLLEDQILNLDGIAKVDKQGYREREISVEVHPHLLNKFHVAMNEIIIALSQKNLNFPGGIIRTKKEDIMIRTIGEVSGASEVKNVLIRANDRGNWVKISDVATVKDTFEEEDIINKTSGKKSITLTAMKKESADIIDVVDKITLKLKEFEKSYPDYKFSPSNDMSYYVKRRLNVLINNGLVGLVFVIMSLLLTLGWRISLVTAVGIPLSFFGTFIWMGQAGVTINLMSMFGLIMVLGMLVDDAIVVAENIYRHIEEGNPIKDAVINGTAEVIVPVAGTILTTIAAFGPLMFMSGIMGKFMWVMPAVVSVALIFSWLESMFILPSHIYDIERNNKNFSKHHKTHKKEGTLFSKIKKRYSSILLFVLSNKYKFALLITVIFFGSVIFAKKSVKIIMFPGGKIERFIIKAESKTGISLQEMNKKLIKIEKVVSQIPKNELDNYITKVGMIREQPMDPGEKIGTNYGMIIVNLTPEENRDRKAIQIIDDIRKKAKLFNKEFEKIEYKFIKQGPPVGTPINITIRGDDFTRLKKIAEEYKAYIKTIPGLKDIKDDFEEGKKEIRIIVDEKVASITGISVYDVASTVRSCFKGTVATTIKKTDEEIDIRVIFNEKLRNDLKSLKKVTIANKMGNLIPLYKIAHFDDTSKTISVINRNQWKRTIKILGDVDERAEGNISALEVNKKIMKKFADIGTRYPGIIVDYLGEFKDTQKSMTDLLKAYLIAFLLIYLILVAIFRSLIHPIVIISIIPLTLVGVIWTFFFHGMPLSFLAIMGVVGLTGVVVNDSIVFVDFIKNARMKGMSAIEASIYAGANRIRPIFLTTITTVFGLLPTAYGWGGYDPFLKPMAVAMSWGLAFATFITLFATPIMYNILTDIRTKLFKIEKSFEFTTDVDNEFNEKVKDILESTIDRNFRERIKNEIKDEMTLELAAKKPVKKISKKSSKKKS